MLNLSSKVQWSGNGLCTSVQVCAIGAFWQRPGSFLSLTESNQINEKSVTYTTYLLYRQSNTDNSRQPSLCGCSSTCLEQPDVVAANSLSTSRRLLNCFYSGSHAVIRGVDPYGTGGTCPLIFMKGDVHGNVPQYFRSDFIQ